MCPTKIGVAEATPAASAAAHENDKAHKRMTGLPVLLSLLCLVFSLGTPEGVSYPPLLYPIGAQVQECLFETANLFPESIWGRPQIVLSDHTGACACQI